MSKKLVLKWGLDTERVMRNTSKEMEKGKQGRGFKLCQHIRPG